MDKNEFLDILRTGTVKPEQKSHYANNFISIIIAIILKRGCSQATVSLR